MANGLTGAQIHIGSWGLPDVGLTEAIGGLFGQQNNQQGGSNLVPDNIQSAASKAASYVPGYNAITNGAKIVSPSIVNGVNKGVSGILGTSTQNNGGGGNPPQQQNQGLVDALIKKGYNPQDAKNAATGPNAGNLAKEYLGTQQSDYDSQISSAYQPFIDTLNQFAGQLGGLRDSALNNVQQSWNEGQQTIGNEKGELQAGLDSQTSSLKQNFSSAADEARRYYNALKQQALSLYGTGSSAGSGVGELATQQYLRNQGQLQNNLSAGLQSLGQEGIKLNNYISEKKTNLDSWLRDAQQQISDNYTSKIAEVNQQRGMAEANKTNAKLAILQQSIQANQQLQQAQQGFMQNLASWTVQQAQSVAQRAFTPEEVASVYNSMMSQNLAGFTGNAIQGGQAAPQQQLARAGSGKSSTDDIIKALG